MDAHKQRVMLVLETLAVASTPTAYAYEPAQSELAAALLQLKAPVHTARL
jgi:hypothetical protein